MRISETEPSANARTEAANYVATLTGELAQLARRHGLDTLSYILDLAHMEAENLTRKSNGGG
jgi:hypothetical protein